jgi:hypothetical protein
MPRAATEVSGGYHSGQCQAGRDLVAAVLPALCSARLNVLSAIAHE